MRALLINSVCGIRSTGRICTDIAKDLQEQGYEVKVAYGRETVPPQYRGLAYRIGSELAVRVNALKCRVFDNDGFSAKAQTKRFLQWAQAYNPDLLWLHNLHGYYLNVEMLFAWIKTRPQMKVKWTLHDCWAFTGHCPYFTAVGCDRWLTACGACAQKKGYPASYVLDRAAVRFAQKKKSFCGVADMEIITPSTWLSGLVKRSFLGEYPVTVVNNKIDLSAFRPVPSDFRAKNGLVGKKIVLGVASAWGERKGFHDFARLAGMLSDEYKLVMVGVSEKQQRQLPKSILALSGTDSKEALAAIYTAADVFFNPTYEDNYPTVNLEARACGTRIVTYDTGGSPESAGEGAVVVPTGDLRAACAAIKALTK